MKVSVPVLCWLLLGGVAQGCAQSDSRNAATSNSPRSDSHASIPASALERDFFAIVRSGDTKQLLGYVPEEGVNIGRDAQPTTRAEIEKQFMHRSGLYCKLFDSSCIQSMIKLDASAPSCSYHELLTQSEKVRTASTETTRNGVRQAIVVAEVHNQKCGGPVLVDFIFNYQKGGWKLFSIP